MADLIADLNIPCTLRRIGVRHYFPSGPLEQLNVLAGLDAEEIANAVEDQFTFRLAGGEDALISCLYALSMRLEHTRFAVSAAPYIERLTLDAAYLRTLRELWKSRALNAKDFPSNDELMTMLKVTAIDTLNPLTGIPREQKHDGGIV